MRSIRLLAFVALLSTSIASAAIDGTVTNKTDNKPQAGVGVSLVKIGQGMENVGSTKTDAQGKFHFDLTPQAGSPYLLQAMWQTVTYNKVLPPGSPTNDVQVEVFNASGKVPAAKVTEHMVLLQPSAEGIGVNETLIYDNTGQVTYNDPKGTLKFFLPQAAQGKVQVTVSAPGGMPIQRPAEKTNQANVYTVNYPVKPGETRFDLAYMVPAADQFSGKALGDEKLRLVVPSGVKLEGDGVTSLGVEPSTKAEIYDVPRNWTVKIQGTGSLRAAGGDQNAAAASDDQQQGPDIEEAKPKIYRKLPVFLTLAGAILTLGFVLLYRRETPDSAVAAAAPATARSGKKK